MALTFTHKSGGDDEYGYEPAEGLALRVAARYFCAPDCVKQFRAVWMSKPELRKLSLLRLLKLVVVPFQKAKCNRLLILVDEPRKAGPTAAYEEVEAEVTAQNFGPDDIAICLQAMLWQAVYDATGACRRKLDANVNFVFSSLEPVIDPAELKRKTASDGSHITWIDVAPAGSSERGKLKQRIMELLPHTPKNHLSQSADFLMVMTSGNWGILWQMFNSLNHETYSRSSLMTLSAKQ